MIEGDFRFLFGLKRFDAVSMVDGTEGVIRLSKLKAAFVPQINKTIRSHLDIHCNARCEEGVLAEQVLENSIVFSYFTDVKWTSSLEPFVPRFNQVYLH